MVIRKEARKRAVWLVYPLSCKFKTSISFRLIGKKGTVHLKALKFFVELQWNRKWYVTKSKGGEKDTTALAFSICNFIIKKTQNKKTTQAYIPMKLTTRDSNLVISGFTPDLADHRSSLPLATLKLGSNIFNDCHEESIELLSLSVLWILFYINFSSKWAKQYGGHISP